MMGGENQQNSLNQGAGYSSKAECTGAPAYLKPNSQSMQKPVGGLSRVCFTETIEDRSRIGCSANQNHEENRKAQPHVTNYLKRGYRLLRAHQYSKHDSWALLPSQAEKLPIKP
jgi:hypothetical protein